MPLLSLNYKSCIFLLIFALEASERPVRGQANNWSSRQNILLIIDRSMDFGGQSIHQEHSNWQEFFRFIVSRNGRSRKNKIKNSSCGIILLYDIIIYWNSFGSAFGLYMCIIYFNFFLIRYHKKAKRDQAWPAFWAAIYISYRRYIYIEPQKITAQSLPKKSLGYTKVSLDFERTNFKNFKFELSFVLLIPQVKVGFSTSEKQGILNFVAKFDWCENSGDLS